MIYVQDNFFPKEDFYQLQKYCKRQRWQTVEVSPGYMVSMIEVPQRVIDQNIEGYELIFTFIRRSNLVFDAELNVHADNVLNGKKVALATVLYINDDKDVTANGTAFWKHPKYGDKLPSVSNEEYDLLLMASRLNKIDWIQSSYIQAVPNRLLTYDADYFHSKWPQVISDGERIVMVGFYSKNGIN